MCACDVINQSWCFNIFTSLLLSHDVGSASQNAAFTLVTCVTLGKNYCCVKYSGPVLSRPENTRKNLAQLNGAQWRGPFNMAPLNSASKYVEELGEIKQDAQLFRGRIKRTPL